MPNTASELAKKIHASFVDAAPDVFADAADRAALQAVVRVTVETHELLRRLPLGGVAAAELDYHCDTIRSALDSLYGIRILHGILRDTAPRAHSWALPDDGRALGERYEAGFAELQRQDISVQQRIAVLLALGKLQLLLLSVAF